MDFPLLTTYYELSTLHDERRMTWLVHIEFHYVPLLVAVSVTPSVAGIWSFTLPRIPGDISDR